MNQCYEVNDFLELVSQAFFKMAFLSNRISYALEEKKFEESFQLSKKGWDLLAVLESILHESPEVESNFQGLIDFCQIANVALKKINVESNIGLCHHFGENCKKLGIEFQKKHQELKKMT